MKPDAVTANRLARYDSDMATEPLIQDRARPSSPDHSSVEAIRGRYLHHLNQQRLAATGYVPNLVPILTWNGGEPLTARVLLSSPVTFLRSLEESSPGDSSRPSPGADHSIDSSFANLQSVEEILSAPERRPLPQESATSKGSSGGLSGFLKPGSIRSSVVNVTAAALGAGALSLPRAIYYSGIIWGPILMILLAVLSMISIKMIVQLVEISGKGSYEEIAKLAFGPWFALLVEVNIILFCFGTAVAYMITVGQVSHQVLDAVFGSSVEEGSWLSTLMEPNSVLILTTVLILLPLSLLDSINDLRYASLAGVSCIIYLIFVVFYIFMTHSISPSLMTEDGFTAWQPKGGMTGVFKMLSLAIFAFCCQPNVPAIYNELERKSHKRMNKVSIGSMMLCCTVYLFMGVTGFLAFGEGTLGNVLQNLQPMVCQNDWVVRSGVACMAFAVTMAFPLNIFPIRFTVESALFYNRPHLNTRAMRTGIAVTAVSCSLVSAIVLPQINLIFELIGATTGSFVCFIGPGLLFCRLVPGHTFSSHKLKAVLLIVVGVIFLLLGTYSSVLDVVAQFTDGGQSTSDPLKCSVLLRHLVDDVA
eukprot:CAMPEP_0115058988 /NCGR_PEP_ID=MMETSP0227-20121206/6660_1 /TAXON_ID=89957 /ORGANISM="Polarella glacialis, Strain CCMP 1383" /LENGTH=588 /DNA_ID=CAMNT_0002444045 /DNA_START=50 /DNA_END=1816 /DNA_ORIENTATION=+